MPTKSQSDVYQQRVAAALALLEAQETAEAHKSAAEAARASVSALVQPVAAAILTAQPVKPAAKETSSWVGSIMGALEVEVDGRKYTVQVSLKDVAASASRAAIVKALGK